MNDKNKKNYLFYSIILTGFTLVIIYFIFGKYINIPKCIFVTKFNIYCPGCGCTRAFISMIKGDFIDSIKFNPSVLYFTVILSFYSMVSILDIITKKNTFSKINMKILFVIGILIMLSTCLIKNIIY